MSLLQNLVCPLFCILFTLSLSLKIVESQTVSKDTINSPTTKSTKVNASDVNLSSLKMVQILFRHGDRSPVKTYPNDPYNKDYFKYWPWGQGQLTEVGKEQHYELGSYFRERYQGFLSSSYKPKDIYVLSSDMDRTLMSAQANIAGLYPKLNVSLKASSSSSDDGYANPVLPAEFTNRLGIQLVPIHALPKPFDNLLRMEAPCPRKTQAQKEFYESDPTYLQFAAENADFMQFFEDTFGVPHLQNMFKTLERHDPLICQKAHNLTLPSWADDATMAKLENIRGIGFKMEHGTTELQRLKGGPLVSRFVTNMLNYTYQQQIKPTVEPALPKLFINSAHDSTLAAVMTAMDIFDPQMPPYATSLMVELHRKPEADGGDYFVNIFYRNTTEGTLYPRQIPGCELSCPLPTFVSLLKPILPTDWEEECKINTADALKNTPTVLSSQTSGLFTAFLCTVCAVASSMLTVLFINRTQLDTTHFRLSGGVLSSKFTNTRVPYDQI